MAFVITCVSVKAQQRDAFLAAAGLTLTDRIDPDGREVLSAAPFGDQYLFWRNLRVAPPDREPDWIALSRKVPFIVLDVVNPVGMQSVRHFAQGREVWAVSYADEKNELLSTSGRLPVDVDGLGAKLRADWLAEFPEDADLDEADLVASYSAELPSRVFEEITGFYYLDGAPENLRTLSGDLPLLRPGQDGSAMAPGAKPWWKFW